MSAMAMEMVMVMDTSQHHMNTSFRQFIYQHDESRLLEMVVVVMNNMERQVACF